MKAKKKTNWRFSLGIDDFTEVVIDNTDAIGGRGYDTGNIYFSVHKTGFHFSFVCLSKGVIARIDLGKSNPSRDIALWRGTQIVLIVTTRGISVIDSTSILRPIKRLLFFFFF